MNHTFTYSPKHPSTNIGGYRYFFNGQEGDNEVFGETTNFGYEFRQYDSRLGRWWSVDPKWSEYPNVSPFVFCNGSPIMMVDPDGRDYDDPPTKYTIKKGDTFWDLECARHLPHGTLQKYNPDLNPNNLQIGQEIYYPYLIGDLLVVDDACHTYSNTDCFAQPSAPTGPTINMDNYNTLAPFLSILSLKDLSFSKRAGKWFSTKNSNKLVPLGKGHTGRYEARNLSEQLAMKEILSDPTKGRPIIRNIKDGRWAGWTKMAWRHEQTEIHYVAKFDKNGKIIAIDDFKFKN